MGIAPYKTFIFDGESSIDYGVYLTGEGVFNAPERAVEMITIPGRNGAFALDQGRFENIEITYKAGMVDVNESNFADKMSSFRNWLCSKVGYCRLEDDYNPNEFRMAVFKNGIEVDHDFLIAGEFEITFECKPQRWLKSGETAITIGEWKNTETESGDIVEVENPDGLLGVKSLSVALSPIQDLNGYDAPWVGGNGANQWDEEWEVGGIDINTGQPYTATDRIRSKNFIPILADTDYYYRAGASGQTAWQLTLGYYDSNKDFISIAYVRNDVRHSPTNAKYARFMTTGGYGNTYNHDISINYPSTVTTYSPYSNICPISGHTEVVTSISPYEQTEKHTITGKNIFNAPNDASQILVACHIDANQSFVASANISCGIRYYDANKTQIDYWSTLPNSYGDRKYRVISSSTAIEYVEFYGSGSPTDLMIELGDTCSDYEPYGYSYTTALGRTVYGGTLDVVSGELVVDRAMVDLGSLNYDYASGVFISYNTGVNLHTKERGGWCISSIYTKSGVASADNMADYSLQIMGGTSNANFYVKNSAYTDTTAFKTAMNGVQLVYELATPQTYQLTPQQIQTILGQNNVWSDAGDITLEYGQLPNVLINPTLFEASPLLAVKGYGDIDLDGYELTVNNALYGDFYMYDGDAWTTTKVYDIDIDTVNTSDTVELSGTFSCRIGANASIINDTVSDSNAAFSSRTGAWQVISYPYSGTAGQLTTDFSTSITIGTNKTVTNTVTVVATSMIPSGTITYTITQTIQYNKTASTVTVTETVTYSTSLSVSVLTDSESGTMTMLAHSTASALGNPTYIDCDLGECYRYLSNGNLMTLNNVVEFGSDLPVLSPGAHAITFDGTVTELKIAPRWWKL